jgi:hypothetical protein
MKLKRISMNEFKEDTNKQLNELQRIQVRSRTQRSNAIKI